MACASIRRFVLLNTVSKCKRLRIKRHVLGENLSNGKQHIKCHLDTKTLGYQSVEITNGCFKLFDREIVSFIHRRVGFIETYS